MKKVYVKSQGILIGYFAVCATILSACHAGNQVNRTTESNFSATSSVSADSSIGSSVGSSANNQPSGLLKDFDPCSITRDTLESLGIHNFIVVNQSEVKHTAQVQKELIHQIPFWQHIKKFTTCVYNENDTTHPGRVGDYFDIEKTDWKTLPPTQGYIDREKHRLLSYNKSARLAVEKINGTTVLVEDSPHSFSCDIILVPYVTILGNLSCFKIHSLARSIATAYH